MVRKVTFREKVTLQVGETIYICVNYIGLPKGHSFIMIANHPVASNTILDSGTPRLVILANPIKKPLKINKGTRIGTIHECADTAYILTDIIYVFAVLATVPSTGIEPLSPIQKDVILGSRYQYVLLANALFGGDTPL